MAASSHSYKRVNEEDDCCESSRPAKRFYGSPRIVFPVTPTRKPSRIPPNKNRLVTKFKSVFSSSRDLSPSSEEDSDETPFPSPLSTPIKDTTYFHPFTPDTPQTLATPRKPSVGAHSVEIFSQLSLQIDHDQCHPIFRIPEILTKILTFVDVDTSVPIERPPIRRRPLSYQHALLIYKDEAKAQKAWSDAVTSTLDSEGNPIADYNHCNSLYNCLFVNKLWYQVAKEVATTKLFFADAAKWDKFVQRSPKRCQLTRSKSNTKLFIMHKLPHAEQEEIETVAPFVSGSLEWIEMYICPKVLPSSLMFAGLGLKKLVLPGSRVVDDQFLNMVARHCPQLETLDLRACGLVTDKGMVNLLFNCNNITTLNLGRHSQSSKITDLTLNAVSKYTQIETLGLAGCSITDSGLWTLALTSSDTLTRLSLNGCVQLTNNSLPRIFAEGLFSNVSVLEIRHILALTNFKPLVLFQRLKYQRGEAVLIEGCEVLEYRMRTEEWKQDMLNSARMLNEIKDWCCDSDDGDIPFESTMATL